MRSVQGDQERLSADEDEAIQHIMRKRSGRENTGRDERLRKQEKG